LLLQTCILLKDKPLISVAFLKNALRFQSHLQEKKSFGIFTTKAISNSQTAILKEILEDYTLEMKIPSFMLDKNETFVSLSNADWFKAIQNQDTSKLYFLPQNVGPDLFCMIKCLPNSESFKKYGPHSIPLTISCHTRAKVEKEEDLWNEKQNTFQSQQSIEEKRKKDLERSDLYNAFSSSIALQEELQRVLESRNKKSMLGLARRTLRLSLHYFSQVELDKLEFVPIAEPHLEIFLSNSDLINLEKNGKDGLKQFILGEASN
jgi:hypothetical protein